MNSEEAIGVIDLGNVKVKCIIFNENKEDKLEILSSSINDSEGIHNGVIVNLDKAFPHHIFSLTIWESSLHNFSYQPHIELKGQKICIKGKVTDQGGIPTMNVENEKAIEFLNN